MISAPVNDVSAVVLSLGEDTTQEAIASLRRQTPRVHDIIVVRDTKPFHNAFNAGAMQVKTPFFVQVDADMILDERCVAALRDGMIRNVGIVVGRLRDALVDQVVGIKLFRTACFESTAFRDSVSPDTDFASEIAGLGWKTVFIGKMGPDERDRWCTFGEHQPNYTTSYTYHKHLLEGARYRYRRTIPGLRWRLDRLKSSTHPAALIAQIGLAQGLFIKADRDLLAPAEVDESFARLERFLRQSETARSCNTSLSHANLPLRERFRIVYRIGHALAAKGPSALSRRLRELDDSGGSGNAWIDTIALCRGLLAQRADDAAIDADCAAFDEFMASSSTPSGSLTAQNSATSNLDEMKAYAAGLQLKRFVVIGAAPAEYRAVRYQSGVEFEDTGHRVVATEPDGRPRIDAPFQLFGHALCNEPQKVSGIFWCHDLLRSGYAFVHVPTPYGPKKLSLMGQIARNIFSRCGLQVKASKDLRSIFQSLTQQRAPRYQEKANCVLMIAPSFNVGGSERQMVVTIAGLIQQGYEVQMIALGRSAPGDPTVESEISRLGVLPQFCSDFATPREGGWRTPANAVFAADLSAVPRWISNRLVPLATAIERYRPAVVHTWLDGPAVVGGLAACALGVPRLVIAQGSLSIRHRRVTPNAHMLTGYRYVARNPNVVMVNNSAAGAADYEHWLGMSGGTIRVLYNGFRPDTVRIPSQTEIGDFRASLGLSAETPVVGTLMRLVEEKDPDLWVDTAAEIAKARPDVRFLIIGYGPLREQILQRAQNAGIGDRTIVKDAMTDVGLGYAVIDVILLTSSVEGVSNTLLEAQAAGRSVVATDVGGMREAVAHGLTGLIVPERSPQRLAGTVLKILNDPTFQTRGRAEGPKFVANRFGLNRMIRETIEAYGRP